MFQGKIPRKKPEGGLQGVWASFTWKDPSDPCKPLRGLTNGSFHGTSLTVHSVYLLDEGISKSFEKLKLHDDGFLRATLDRGKKVLTDELNRLSCFAGI